MRLMRRDVTDCRYVTRHWSRKLYPRSGTFRHFFDRHPWFQRLVGLGLLNLKSDCRNTDGVEEIPCEFVVASDDASVVFEFVEEPLDQIALLRGRGADAVLDLAVLPGRNVRLGAMPGDQVADRLGVVAAVADRAPRQIETADRPAMLPLSEV